MKFERTLKTAFFVSCLLHVSILFLQPDFLTILPSYRKNKPIEVHYLKQRQKTKEYSAASAKKEAPLRFPAGAAPENKTPPPFLQQDALKSVRSVEMSHADDFNKPIIAKTDMTTLKKKISMPPVDLDKIDNPSYISYYQIVREKIKRCAYQNYMHTEIGDVYVSFIVSNDGHLRDSRLVPEKSSPSEYLCQTALKSIGDAAPFPVFPKELEYPQLSFNVIISFEIE